MSEQLISEAIAIGIWEPDPGWEQAPPVFKLEPEKRKEFCFRVETDEGTGMYGVGSRVVSEKFCYWPRHPTPKEDALLCDFYMENIHKDYWTRDSPYYFGFSTMEQLRRWVYTGLDELASKGLKISIYQTDDYCIGDTQMVFRKSTATLIGRADLI